MNFKETNAFPECDQAFTSASTRGSRSSLVTALCPSRPSKTTRTGRSITSPHPRVLLCSGTPTCRATLSTLARLAYCASERLRLDCVWAGTATLCTRARSLGSVSRSRCGPLSSGTGPLIAPQVPATPSAPSVRTPSPCHAPLFLASERACCRWRASAHRGRVCAAQRGGASAARHDVAGEAARRVLQLASAGSAGPARGRGNAAVGAGRADAARSQAAGARRVVMERPTELDKHLCLTNNKGLRAPLPPAASSTGFTSRRVGPPPGRRPSAETAAGIGSALREVAAGPSSLRTHPESATPRHIHAR